MSTFAASVSEDAAEHEQCVGLDSLVVSSDHHVAEDEGVDEQEQQRIEEGPEEPENRPPVACLQLPRDQALDQAAVAAQAREITEH
jgi:hypothetical protein